MLRTSVLIAGLSLIVLSFVLLVEIRPWSGMIWLNLAVVVLVFLVNYTNVFLLKLSPVRFQATIPTLGVLWMVDGAYTLFSLGAIWRAYLFRWSFETALVVQLTLIFAVGVMIVAARGAQEVAGRTQEHEKATRDLLDRVRGSFQEGSVGVAALRPVDPELERGFVRLRDDLRYLSPVSTKSAADYESRLLSESHAFLAEVVDASGPRGEPALTRMREGLARMNDLIALRKTCRNEADGSVTSS